MSEFIERKSEHGVQLLEGDGAIVFRGEDPEFEAILVGDFADEAVSPQSHINITMMCILFSGRPEANAIKDRLMEIMLHRPDPDDEPVSGSS